jgi:Rrf2 family protein
MSQIVTLSEASTIGLHSIVLMAQNGGSMNVDEIARRTGSSRHHISKILQRLAKSGFLLSHRGPQGGFSLKKEPKDMTLLDIYECIEGKIAVSKCPLDHPICAFDKCLLNGAAQSFTLKIRDYLASHKVSDYIP